MRGIRAFFRIFEPLRVIFYPYVRWALPRETNKPYTPEQAVDRALGGFCGFIRPSQVRWEILSLSKLVERLRPKIVVEVGTSKGGTLFIWARLVAKDAHLVSIDLPGGENNWAYPRWKEPFYKSFASKGQKIDLLRGDSQSAEMLARLKNILGGKQIDFLFIDADHSYEGVKKDYELYSPLVRHGGMIAFHDVAKHAASANCGVTQLWAELKAKNEHQELIEDQEQGWGGIGVLMV